MFSCLNYGGHDNKVLPIPGNIPYNKLPEDIKLTYNTLEKTAIIRIEGMGTNTPNTCKNVKNVHFVNVSYASRGISKDALSLRSNSMSLRSGSSDIAHGSQRRLYDLIKKIKEYLLNNDMEKVIVIGVSHGSLIVHAAFLKLQMDTTLTTDELNKIHIYTVGSPRYLPKGLLPEQKLLNFYHVKDKMIRLVNMLPFGGCKVPDLKQAESKFISTGKEDNLKGEHIYDKENAIIYVNKCNFIPDGKQNPVYENYYSSHLVSQVNPTFDFSLFHAYLFILYPLMDFSLRYVINELTFFDETYNPYKLVDCNETQPGTTEGEGGGSNKQHLKYQNKLYKIRKDKVGKYITIKKVKTYLKEIRGKYRYTTNC